MSRLFIDRPIFAWVLAIIVMLGGAGALEDALARVAALVGERLDWTALESFLPALASARLRQAEAARVLAALTAARAAVTTTGEQATRTARQAAQLAEAIAQLRLIQKLRKK